jgi:hypothetical protein
MDFTDLLTLDIPCEPVAVGNACLVAIGDGAGALVEELIRASRESAVPLARVGGSPGALRLWFGLPLLIEPFPVLVGNLMTERNTMLNQLSLFGWVEDNAILEPRAELLGLTPLADDPVTFLRDIDLDRPPEVYARPGQPAHWLRVVGVVIARCDHAGDPVVLAEHDAALSALEVVLPPDAQPFVNRLRAEVASGTSLRQALRAHRRGTAPAIMAACDGWRVLARAARFALANPARAAQAAGLFRLSAPRRW